MSERDQTFNDAVRGLSRPQQARVALNWKSQTINVDFHWWELRAAELTTAILVPAIQANEATWDRVWSLIADALHDAGQRGAGGAMNQGDAR